VSLYRGDFLSVSLPVTLPARGVRLVLRRGASLEVHVLDESGHPLVGSEVQLVEGFTPSYTDDSGKVTLKTLRPGRHRVVAARPGDEPLRTVSGEVEVRDSEHLSLELRFAPGQRLSGVVVDARGQPVAGAEVRSAPAALRESLFLLGEQRPFFTRLQREWHAGSPQPTRTGPEGRFTLTHLAPGAVLVTAHKDGYTLDARATAGQVRKLGMWPGVLAEPGSSGVRLVMTPQGYARGRVVGADGAPLTRFTLDDQTYEDTGGAFRLPIRESGERMLLFRAPGLASTTRRAHLREGLDTDLGEVVMDAGRQVRLRVVDADTSLPVEDALVDVRDPADTEAMMDKSLLYPYPLPPPGEPGGLLWTAEDGTVSLPHVEEQPREVLVLHCGYLSASVPLGARQRELTVTLRPGARVAGAVSVGGEVSGHGGVEVLTPKGQEVTHADIKEGRYRTCALEAGRYTVQVELHVFENRMFPSHASRVVDVPARGTVQVDFDAPRGGAVVRVSTPAGTADKLLLVPGSHPLPVTRAQYLQAEARAHTPMYGGGSYTFRLIPPGLYTLLAVKDSRARPVELHVEELLVPESGTLTQELQPRWQQGPDSLSSD
jgi:hypothetical protein